MLRIPLPEYDGFALCSARRMLCKNFFPPKNWGKAPCAFMGVWGRCEPPTFLCIPWFPKYTGSAAA